MIDCIHAKAQDGETVQCESNRLLPIPKPGGTVRRSIAVCLHPCPYRDRPNLEPERWKPGTALANALRRLGIRKCRGCGRRERWINRQWTRVIRGFRRESS